MNADKKAEFAALIVAAWVACGANESVAAAPRDDLTVEAAVSSQRPFLGDAVVIRISVRHTNDKPPELDSSPLDGIGARPIGEPKPAMLTVDINGRRSTSYTVTQTFQFVPQAAGRITVPAVSARQGNQTAKTEPIEIDVIGPEPQDWAVLEIAASETSVVAGQSITLTIELFLRRLEHDGEFLASDPFDRSDAPQIVVPWIAGTDVLKPSASWQPSLKKRAAEDGPGFPVHDRYLPRRAAGLIERFIEPTQIRFDRTAVERSGLDDERHAYYRYSLPLEYRATRTGTVGPLTAQLRGAVFVDVRSSPRGLIGVSKDLFAVATSKAISVVAVPNAGQPATFTGGVGNFTIRAAAQPTKIHVGDPIRLTVRIDGSGNLEEIGPPNLAAQPKWDDQFKIHDDAAGGRIDGNAKEFAVSVRPKHGDVKELPPIRFSFFNPKTKKYQEAFSERIPLDVTEVARLDPNDIVDATPADRAKRDLEELSSGIGANFTGPDVLDSEGPLEIGPAQWLALFVGPAALWIALFALACRIDAVRRNPARQRARTALQRATGRMNSLPAMHSPDFHEQLARAVCGYVADRLDLAAGELTPDEARQHTRAIGTGPELADALGDLLEDCDRARFARPESPSDPTAIVQRARSLLEQVEAAVTNGDERRPESPVRASSAASILALVAGLLAGHARAAASAPLDRREVLGRAGAAFERGVQEPDADAARRAFAEAAAEYELLVADGVENGKLEFNLASGYFRAGDVPRAILHFAAAERLRPRDYRVSAALALARSKVPERVESAETGRLARQFGSPLYNWSIRERSTVALIAAAFGWTLLFARIRWPRRWLAVVGAISLTISGGLVISARVEETNDVEQPAGVLVSGDVVARTGPGESYEPQFNRPLGAGVEFRVRERHGDWLRIELPDHKSGWVPIHSVAIASRWPMQ